MGGPKYVATMPEWMSDIKRRVEKLERRKHHRAFVRNAGGFTASEAAVVTLAVGTVLADNGDGTWTVVQVPALPLHDEL